MTTFGKLILSFFKIPTGRSITGFSLHDHPTEPAVERRFFSTSNTQFALSGAGTETAPCNNGTPLTTLANAPTAPLIRF